MWKIIDSGLGKAAQHMEKDEMLLKSMSDADAQPVLHFYEWERAATYGHFIKPEDFLDMEAVARHRIDLARRPTGGGIVFHLTDFAFSLLIPSSHRNFSLNTLENYAFVNGLVIETIHHYLGNCDKAFLLGEEGVAVHGNCQNFCMAHPTKFDVVINGRKVGGAAQRKTKYGFLHQGTISLGLTPYNVLSDILLDHNVLEGMRKTTLCLVEGKEVQRARGVIKEILAGKVVGR